MTPSSSIWWICQDVIGIYDVIFLFLWSNCKLFGILYTIHQHYHGTEIALLWETYYKIKWKNINTVFNFCNFSHVIQPDKTEGMFQNQNLSGEQSTCIQAHLIYSSSSIAYTINSYTKSTLSRGVNLYMSLFLLL